MSNTLNNAHHSLYIMQWVVGEADHSHLHIMPTHHVAYREHFQGHWLQTMITFTFLPYCLLQSTPTRPRHRATKWDNWYHCKPRKWCGPTSSKMGKITHRPIGLPITMCISKWAAGRTHFTQYHLQTHLDQKDTFVFSRRGYNAPQW